MPSSSTVVAARCRALAPQRAQRRDSRRLSGRGLAGSGHDELPYLLTGARPARHGTLQLAADTHDLAHWDTRAAIAAGVALVPEGREHAGLALTLPVADNVLLPRR